MPDLTSTTAPGKVFASRQELADHYKSDWHKYNLKRREAGLPVLLQVDFEARLEAAKALRQEKQAGTSHLKKSNNKRSNSMAKSAESKPDVEMVKDESAVEDETTDQSDKKVEIDPLQCLFDRHHSATVQANVDRMYRKYGFFLPDREYLTDLTGLIGYCHEKIQLGHVCLYCQRIFPTAEGCRKHMVAKKHCKLAYDPEVDLEEFDVFYDFSEADADFMGRKRGSSAPRVEEDDIADDDNDDEDAWEDVSDDEDEAMAEDNEEEEDDEFYEGFQEAVTRMGLDVTPLGELIFPDGRIIGHRSLRRYYKQRVPTQNQSTAVVAARQAAGERLYKGRVYNIHSEENSLALAQAGISPSLAAGRAGKGLLVAGKGGQYTQLSVYRYKAAVQKQRRQEFQAKRIWEKQGQNMNKMDKKGNRLMNGVNVQMALR